jgi:hypothetical protein
LYAGADFVNWNESVGTIGNRLKYFFGSPKELIWKFDRVDCVNGSGLQDCTFITNLATDRQPYIHTEDEGVQDAVGAVPASSLVIGEQRKKWKVNLIRYRSF